jgi:hypothetical protein
MIHIEQRVDFETSRETVWAFLDDVDRVAACMPGVTSLEHLGNDTYRVQLGVQVGPIKAHFAGKVTIYERVALERMLVRLDWKDAETASKARAEGAIELSQESPEAVTVLVNGDVDLMGVLGKYGGGIADRKAAEIAQVFAECARAELGLTPRPKAPPKAGWWARLVAALRRLAEGVGLLGGKTGSRVPRGKAE